MPVPPSQYAPLDSIGMWTTEHAAQNSKFQANTQQNAQARDMFQGMHKPFTRCSCPQCSVCQGWVTWPSVRHSAYLLTPVKVQQLAWMTLIQVLLLSAPLILLSSQ
eukprot:5642187-Amphidinium_carterae.2